MERITCRLPSKRNVRIPVPNRYFGVFQDGEIKYRGIELRHHDTPPWVAKTQLAVLQCLAQAKTLALVQAYISQACEIVAQAKRDLRAGRVPVDDLLITQRLSREVEAYKSPSPAARAALQLVEMGIKVAPGQAIQFVYTLGKPGVWVQGANSFNEKTLAVEEYSKLLQRAALTILEPFVRDLTSSPPILSTFGQPGSNQPPLQKQAEYNSACFSTNTASRSYGNYR